MFHGYDFNYATVEVQISAVAAQCEFRDLEWTLFSGKLLAVLLTTHCHTILVAKLNFHCLGGVSIFEEFNLIVQHLGSFS